MAEVKKNEGTNPSERYLAALAERSFLNLWSYPNVFIDRTEHGRIIGKELCDVLVVCGEHIIVFSAKDIRWPVDKEINLAWKRWYSRAIKKSAQQASGAARWIRNFPNRIFLDPKCTQPLPLSLPPSSVQKIHCVVVALGAGDACRAHFNGGSGSLVVTSNLLGDEHTETNSPNYSPFVIGDVDPDGSYIHVFDDTTLDILLRELDTITDFTSYLRKKEMLIRSRRLVSAHGEEDLLAYYLQRVNSNREHDFLRPDGKALEPNDHIELAGGFYDLLLTSPQYARKKEADEISYTWDRLIETFTRHMLAGTTIVPDGGEFILAEHELGVRQMALEPRTARRAHAAAIIGALERGRHIHRFFRAMLPSPVSPSRTTAFFFLTFAYPKGRVLRGGYGRYRKIRANTLLAYALGMLRKFKHLERVVGIATEPPGGTRRGGATSEDMIVVQPVEWTPELDAEAVRLCEFHNIMVDEQLKETRFTVNEYPEPGASFPTFPGPVSLGNRRDRRAARAKARRG